MEIISAIFASLWSIGAFIVALSVIVAVHEYGHYIVGRWSGIKADVFSLGFGPVIASRVDRHGTRWQIAALPFGGYVKFRGDSNAASAADHAALADLPADDRRATLAGAPIWARMATVAAGPVFNFILAFVIFTVMIMARGVADDPSVVGQLRPHPVATDIQPGDRIVAIEDIVLDGPNAAQLADLLPLKDNLIYSIDRGGDRLRLTGPYYFPAQVSALAPQSAAMDVDLRAGDVITAVNGTPTVSFMQVKTAVESSKGAPLLLTVWRQGQELEFALTPRRVDEPRADGGFDTQWRVGIINAGLFYDPARQSAPLLLAARAAVDQVGAIISGSISGLYHMITGQISSCNLSGPVRIAETSAQMASQGTSSFIWFIAVLSVAIGFMNLFPLPVLDGGHLVFFTYEALTGRPPNPRVLNILMMAGMAAILSLMVFSLGNDLFCP